HHTGFDSMRLELASDGALVGRNAIAATIRYTNSSGSTCEIRDQPFERADDGTYVAAGIPSTGVPTQYVTVSTTIDGATLSTTAPVVNVLGGNQPPLRRPLENYAYMLRYHSVEVEGERYFAAKVAKDELDGLEFYRWDRDEGPVYLEVESPRGNPQAWVVFDSAGRPVTDDSLRRKAALAAFVSEKVAGLNRDHVLSYYGQEYPASLRTVRDTATLSRGVLAVRDTAAEGIGEIAGTSTSGGFSTFLSKGGSETVLKEGAEQAAAIAANKIRREFVERLLEEYVSSREELRTDPLPVLEEGFRQLANDELTESASQAETAADVVRGHPADEPWSYEEATRFWRNYRESTIDGLFYMTLRANLLPDGDALTQLRDVTLEAIEGGSGLPVDALYDALTGGELGYLSEAVTATEFVRAKIAVQEREFGAWSQQAQSAAIRAQTDTDSPIFRAGTVQTPPDVNGVILDVSPPSGTYRVGEPVEVSVTVENAGQEQHTFFVGYSTRDPEGEFHDNYGTTGTPISLAPEQQRTVSLDWVVESDVPPGEYDFVVSIWQESDRDALEHRLDTIEQTDVFAVENDGPVLTIRDPSPVMSASGETTTVTFTIENTGTDPASSPGFESLGLPPGIDVLDVHSPAATDTTDGTVQLADLPAGESHGITVTYEIGDDADPGRQSIRATVASEGGAADTVSVSFTIEHPVLSKYDSDDDGTISTAEFVDGVGKWAETDGSTAELRTLLRAWATDGLFG
ncbi:MAG: hypothetical protein V5A27_05895, partial [Halapricum sp.]